MRDADLDDSANREIYIYIVDDEPMIAEMMEVVFSMQGFRTKVFNAPEPVLESLRKELNKPDILLTDFLMESMNGMDLIRACRTLHPCLCTLLCSGHVNPEQLASYADPPDAFVAKPFLPAELVEKARGVLARQRG